MNKISIFALFGLVWLLSSCSSQKPVVYAENELIPKDKTLLWKISGNGLKKPSYLYGTIHLIPKEDFVLTPATSKALAGCERIAFEIDMKDMMNLTKQFGMMTKMFMKNGTTLRDLLSPEDYALVRNKMDGKGMPASMLERIKPMFLSTMFGSDGEEDGGMGGFGLGKTGKMTSVEMELYKKSKKLGLSSAGLETAESQLAIFDVIPYEAQAKMLVESIRAESPTDGENSMFVELLKLYKSGDVALLHDQTVQESNSGIAGFENVLLYNRNRNWIPLIRDMGRMRPTFFAVGAGHLGGDQGVIALLRRAGFRVDPVFSETQP